MSPKYMLFEFIGKLDSPQTRSELDANMDLSGQISSPRTMMVYQHPTDVRPVLPVDVRPVPRSPLWLGLLLEPGPGQVLVEGS